MPGDANRGKVPNPADRTPSTEGGSPVSACPLTATFPAEPPPSPPPQPGSGEATALATAADPHGGSTGLVKPPAVPGYQPVRKLGEGTYGQVWLYEEERTGIRVAIKFFSRCWGLEWQLLQAEVKQLALLHADPGIVQLIDVEPHNDPPYYVMSYAPGGSLQSLLADGKPLTLKAVEPILRQITEALAYVHSKGVRHCDLKPGNVLLDTRDRALLADFGQAHLASDVSPALGTFFYMAPEQAVLENTIADTRWDVYGMGAVFYAMLIGHPPRENPALADDLARTHHLATRLQRYRDGVREAPPPREHHQVPGIDAALAYIIDRCLDLDPARRFRDAGAVLEALERRDRIKRRRPLLVVGLIVPLLLLLLLTGLTYRNGMAQIRAAEHHLANQLQESDRVSARLVANVVEDHLQDRIEFLERFVHAHQAQLAAVQRGRAARDGLRAVLKQLADEAHHRELFGQFSVADADGYILAGVPVATEELKDETGQPRCWAFRDWFNGRGDQLDGGALRYAPIRQVHISQPYESRSPGHPFSVNFSIPIIEADGRVVGVLTAMVPIRNLHTWLEGVEISRGCVLLFNERGQCLKHNRMDRIIATRDHNPIDWRPMCPLYRRALEGQAEEGMTPAYYDPIEGKDYLAGYARFTRQPGRTSVPWLAVVQHERASLLQPVADLKTNLLGHCLMAILAGSMVIVLVWGGLIVALRREMLGLRH